LAALTGLLGEADRAYRQVKARLDLAVTDLGATKLKNIAEPIRAYSLQVGGPASAKPASAKPARRSDAFETRGDIDAVTHQIAVALFDDISHMDPDAEEDASVLWQTDVGIVNFRDRSRKNSV
jgi:hypothetical protein